MERPHTDPSNVVAQRYNLANLRVQLRLAEDQVTGLDEFELEWNGFVGAMREIVKFCEEENVPLHDPELDDLLKNVEAIRLDLASRQQIVLPEFRDPLAKFLRTSVRTYSDALWTLIGVSARDSDGTLMLPLSGDGEPLYQVSLKHFEINTDEARGEIARRRRILNEDVRKLKVMLEEAERSQGEPPKLEVAKIKVMPLVLARIKQSPVGKFVWWFGEEPLRKWLGAALVAGLVALVKWLSSR